jgi:hypothetical protein
VATLRFEVKGELGAITLRAFMEAIAANVRMLKDYERGLSGEVGAPANSLTWVITDVSKGSVVLDVRSESAVEGVDLGLDVAQAHVEGWQQIERQGTTPPYLTEDSMRQARKVAKLIGREGVAGFAVRNLNGRVDERAEVSGQSAVNLDQLLPVKQHALGSIEGTVETVSIHGGRRFIVYLNRTKKAVTCNFGPEEDWLRLAADHLGSRVIVRGDVYRNGRGEPLRIDVHHLRLIRPDDELPTVGSLTGSRPDLTGDLSTEEYMRDIRSA